MRRARFRPGPFACPDSPPDTSVRLCPALVGLVVLGGTLGTAARHALETAFGAPPGQFPWITFAINVGGAFLLGVLLELLVLVGPAGDPRRRAVQVTLGVGLLGGFTTYSTFALETVLLGSRGSLAFAMAYAAASVVAGFAAAYGATIATSRLLRATGRLP